jgi:hypothetical protein
MKLINKLTHDLYCFILAVFLSFIMVFVVNANEHQKQELNTVDPSIWDDDGSLIEEDGFLNRFFIK